MLKWSSRVPQQGQPGEELVDDDTLIETSGAYPPGTASFIRALGQRLFLEKDWLFSFKRALKNHRWNILNMLKPIFAASMLLFVDSAGLDSWIALEAFAS